MQYRTPLDDQGRPVVGYQRNTIGCDIDNGVSAFWSLPTGTREEVCANPLEDRSIHIMTTAPWLVLGSGDLIIVDEMGNVVSHSFKEAKGDSVKFNEMLLYGGGELEIVANTEFIDRNGQFWEFTAHFPDPDEHLGAEEYLTGINPTDTERQSYFTLVGNSMSAAEPNDVQLGILERVTGTRAAAKLEAELSYVYDEVMAGIICRETQGKQFHDAQGDTTLDSRFGFPIIEVNGGYGMFQLTSDPIPSYLQKWNWREGLIETARRDYEFVNAAADFADNMTVEEKRRIYFRELLARHNHGIHAYFESDTAGNTTRRPIVCREPVTFDNAAPNTPALYLSNMNDQGFTRDIRTFSNGILITNVVDGQSVTTINCPVGEGRDIEHNGTSITRITSCRPGASTVNGVVNIPVPTNVINMIANYVTNELQDANRASCHGLANAGRKILGSLVDGTYTFQEIGPCHSSAVCYVDSDSILRPHNCNNDVNGEL